MPDWLLTTLWIVGGVLVVFFVGGMMLPREFKVSRSIVVAAPLSRVHPFLDDFAKWPRWSPFDTPDLGMVWEKTSAPVAGVGAKRSWTSEKLGDGSQWITASDPKSGVSLKLAVAGGRFEPFDLDFALTPEADGTRVVCTESGRLPSAPHWRWMGNLMLGPLCGRMFEKGLKALQRVVEEESSTG